MEMLRKLVFWRTRESDRLSVKWNAHPSPSVIRSLGYNPLLVVLLSVMALGFLAFCGAFLALAPIIVGLLMGLIVFLIVFFLLFAKVAPGAPAWVRAMFLIVIGHMVLASGFAGIALPFGSAPIPITDIVLAWALLMCLWMLLGDKQAIRLPVAMWAYAGWVVCNLAVHLPADYEEHGLAAARDGIRFLEHLTIIPGYMALSLALSKGEPGMRWLRAATLVLAVSLAVYGLLSPAQTFMYENSPAFPGIQKWTPVLGNYQTWPMVGLVALFAALAWRWSLHGKLKGWQWALVLTLALSGLTAFAVLQSRAGYVFTGMALFILLLIGGQGRQVVLMLSFMAACAVALLAIEVSGVEIKGRVGTLSLTGVVDHVRSLTGESRSQEFQGAAGGISQRKAWREYSLHLWSESAQSRVIGIGMGQVLTDLTVTGAEGKEVAVQDPHNSFVTTLTRAGLVGLTAFLGLMLWVLYMGWAGYRSTKDKNRPLAAFFLTLLMFQVYSIVDAWGQPHYEVSHYVVPSFFIYGAAWAIWDHFVKPAQEAKRKRLEQLILVEPGKL